MAPFAQIVQTVAALPVQASIYDLADLSMPCYGRFWSGVRLDFAEMTQNGSLQTGHRTSSSSVGMCGRESTDHFFSSDCITTFGRGLTSIRHARPSITQKRQYDRCLKVARSVPWPTQSDHASVYSIPPPSPTTSSSSSFGRWPNSHMPQVPLQACRQTEVWRSTNFGRAASCPDSRPTFFVTDPLMMRHEYVLLLAPEPVLSCSALQCDMPRVLKLRSW